MFIDIIDPSLGKCYQIASVFTSVLEEWIQLSGQRLKIDSRQTKMWLGQTSTHLFSEWRLVWLGQYSEVGLNTSLQGKIDRKVVWALYASLITSVILYQN